MYSLVVSFSYMCVCVSVCEFVKRESKKTCNWPGAAATSTDITIEEREQVSETQRPDGALPLIPIINIIREWRFTYTNILCGTALPHHTIDNNYSREAKRMRVLWSFCHVLKDRL